ncbi:hypothetical protein C8A03DRAFT_30198 [Achaetomium macrosporum]|uniref:Mitochondrial outer membrane transport complex Sam37/metaxin N-terminal domain-containing protein n=1 Tax=Achaetomium macrosporum TaxID=79813 RepID=A0AAN7CHB8_9PEZI|nr:hypothetical protein C8A03DRAFT_30198 [Achaetomium macrosporum]
MASTPSSAPNWHRIQIPRPLQRLFDRFPLRTYEPNDLPQRSQHLTSSDIATLYVFSTDEDARIGAPSFNPGCLKWQTLLRLANLQFRILPSTNHASPTGSLPFLLPPRTSPTSSPPPIPADKLLSYAAQQQHTPSFPAEQPQQEDSPSSLKKSQAYLSLITLSLRNAWLHALYLDPCYTALLRRLYIAPCSSSRAVQTTLLYQLRRAAAEQILASSTNKVVSSSSPAGAEAIDEEVVYAAAWDALCALASLLAESETGWFFGAQRPGTFDASLFAYTHLMMEYMPEGSSAAEGRRRTMALGAMVARAGKGELARHRERVLRVAWPGWDGRRGG